MSMKIFTVGLIIISALVMASMVLTSSTPLQASSKGLKLYLTAETNLRSQDVGIYTNQYGHQIYIHNGFINTGTNDFTLNYPSGLVDNGPFQICVATWNNGIFCGNGYNSEEKKPESVYVNLFRAIQGEDNQDQSQSQSQSQGQTVIVCPANAKCIIEK